MRAPLMQVLLGGILLAGSSGFGSAKAAEVDCRLGFSLSGWSEKNQSGTGVGTIRCSDNESTQVKIKVKGEGIKNKTAKIESGRGEFSTVSHINDLLGAYASREAAAGDAQVLSRGTLRLTLSGAEGWDGGVRFTSFELTPRRAKSP